MSRPVSLLAVTQRALHLHSAAAGVYAPPAASDALSKDTIPPLQLLLPPPLPSSVCTFPTEGDREKIVALSLPTDRKKNNQPMAADPSPSVLTPYSWRWPAKATASPTNEPPKGMYYCQFVVTSITIDAQAYWPTTQSYNNLLLTPTVMESHWIRFLIVICWAIALATN